MTEGQFKEYTYINDIEFRNCLSKTTPLVLHKYIDYLNAHYFDYRGLIDKGLAIDATNLNIYLYE